VSLRPDDDSAESDPLLLFETEPHTVEATSPTVEIPKEIEARPAPLELEALLHRAETAERALRESRRETAALKRHVATLVSAATDNRAKGRRRSAATVGVAAMCLLALAALAWQLVPAAVPSAVAAEAPAIEPDTPTPAESPQPVAGVLNPVAAPPAAPRRDVPARLQEPMVLDSRTEYVGTLSIDAVPSGGEVFINRKSVGMAPVRVAGLRAGSHLVWISRDGYRRFTRVVLVPANQVSRVSVTLEPF